MCGSYFSTKINLKEITINLLPNESKTYFICTCIILFELTLYCFLVIHINCFIYLIIFINLLNLYIDIAGTLPILN